MTLVGQLHYRYPRRNIVRRAVVRLAATRPAAWGIARVLPALDRRLLNLTGGRFSLTEIAAGTPVISLTTRGAKSGRPRTSLLLGIPLDENLAVIGTNFAQPGTPKWVGNLLNDPLATVSYRRSKAPVFARAVHGSEYEQVFAAAALVYPGYAVYRSRLTKRPPEVFVLEPRAGQTSRTTTGGLT